MMNLDYRDSQIRILLINIDFLSRSLFSPSFCIPHKPAEVDEKSEESNLGQGCVLTD